MSVSDATNSRNAKTWLSSAGGGATARAARAQEGNTVYPPAAAKGTGFTPAGAQDAPRWLAFAMC